MFLSRWRDSPEAAQAIWVVDQLENVYRRFDEGQEMDEEIEVLTVRYKHALRRLQVKFPDELPELVLEPQLQRAEEQRAVPIRLWAPRAAAVGVAAALSGLL